MHGWAGFAAVCDGGRLVSRHNLTVVARVGGENTVPPLGRRRMMSRFTRPAIGSKAG